MDAASGGKRHLPVCLMLRRGFLAGALAVLVRLLVADEHVVGLLAGGDGQDALLDFGDIRRLLPVQVAAGGVGACSTAA